MPTRTRSALVLCLALALPASLLAAAVPEQPATPTAPADSCGAQPSPSDALAQILQGPTTGLEGAIAADSSLAVCCQQRCDAICNGCHGRVVTCRPALTTPPGCLAICGICPPGC